MAKIELELKDGIYNAFNEIVLRGNKSINEVLYRLIIKTIEENNTDWLFGNYYGEVNGKNQKKKNAINVFKKDFHNINIHNTNFASKNTSNNTYWINPHIKCLSSDWFIILNDTINHKLFLFYIPSGQVNASSFVYKNSEPNIMDISIIYNDEDFTDMRSGFKFKKFLVKELEYNTLL